MTNIWYLKKQQKAFYNSIVSIYCPILNDTVYFTSEGFNHLLYETHNKPRTIDEQFFKLKCLTHAPDVVKNCAVITETRKIKKKIKGKIKDGIHYELVHEVKPGTKIRVIVEKIGTGKYKFLSVMNHLKRKKTKKRP